MSEYLEDGFSTIYTFENAPNILLKELEVTPPGLDSGGPIETFSMRSTKWLTKAPKSLIDMTPGKALCAYDPAILDTIVAQVRINQLITITYPDGDTMAFYGYIDKWIPGSHKHGDRPTAEMTVQPTNEDNDGNEIDPVHTPAA